MQVTKTMFCEHNPAIKYHATTAPYSEMHPFSSAGSLFRNYSVILHYYLQISQNVISQL